MQRRKFLETLGLGVVGGLVAGSAVQAKPSSFAELNKQVLERLEARLEAMNAIEPRQVFIRHSCAADANRALGRV